jgi:hypothetical protein
VGLLNIDKLPSGSLISALVSFKTQHFYMQRIGVMTKGERQNLKSSANNFPKEFEVKTDNIKDIKVKEITNTETVVQRDFSSIFARLKKSARKKSAGIF